MDARIERKSYNTRSYREFVHLLRMQMKCKKIKVRVEGNTKPQGV